MQRLSRFIHENEAEILNKWEAFARSLPGGSDATVEALRDHAEEMLQVIADDLDKHQTIEHQFAKSLGQRDASARTATAAQRHGADRAESGYSVSEMVAEFRALRASVLRLWMEKVREAGPDDMADMTRFNEAIDQAIAESISRYAADVEAAKERFIAILGHDLATPLGAIATAAKFMIEAPHLTEPQRTLVSRIDSSATRMNQMVIDLLDFTRTRLGESIPITRAPMDLREVVEAAVDEITASYPASAIEFDASGDLKGQWDRERLMQVTANLIGNAVQHGSPEAPVTITAHGETRQVALSITNMGPAIPKDQFSQLFFADKRRPDGRKRGHLGLGLYIVNQIVMAHGGSVDVQSSESQGTTFTVRLPR